MNEATEIRRLNEAKRYIHPYVDFHVGDSISDDKQISINQVYLNIRGVLGSMHKKQGMPEVFRDWYLHEKSRELTRNEIILDLVWIVDQSRLIGVSQDTLNGLSRDNKILKWISEDDYKFFNERFEQCINAVNHGYGDDHSGTTHSTF